MGPIRILLVEDHQILREGTRQLLERDPGMVVVGEAADGVEAVRMAASVCPDVVVMDVHLPRVNGIEATRLIKERHPGIRILILSAYDDDRYVFPLIDAGASGYLLKTSGGAELARAIRTVQNGTMALDQRIASKVVARLARQQSTRRVRTVDLTERELAVLRGVAQGQTNKGIGEALLISPQTVQVHLRNIFSKLGTGSRAESAVYAISQGWIRLESDRERRWE